MTPAYQNILITGGAGYIGSVLIPMLLRTGKRVTLLDTFQTTSPEQLATVYASYAAADVRVIKGDIRDEAVVQESLNDTEAVIYLAGVSDGRAGRLNPQLTAEVNIDAFQNFALQARASGCRRFVFASTFGVYGYSYQEPLTELLKPNPQEPYSSSKFKAEQFLLDLNDEIFTTVSLRLAMVYGYSPNMRLEFVVNRLIHDAITKGEITILGGSQIRPQIHIKDAGRYFAGLLDLPEASISGEVFNACGFNKSLLQIAGEIKDILGGKISIENLPGRANETSFVLNQDKLTMATGLRPKISFAEAIDELQANRSIVTN